MQGRNKKIAFITSITSSIVIGVIIHGMMIFNKLSWHDDAGAITDSIGVTFTSGRWFLEYVGRVVKWLFGENVSLPVMHGVLSLTFIGITTALICMEFGIKRKSSMILMSAIAVAFPTVTATFAYMFTSGYYFFACMLATFGGVCILRGVDNVSANLKHKIVASVLGILCIGFATGIYQSYFVIGVCVVYLGILRDALIKDYKVSKFLKITGVRIIVTLMGLITYLLLNWIVLSLNDTELSGYEALNTIYSPSLGRMLQGVINSMRSFFGIFIGNYMGFYNGHLVRIIAVVLICITIYLFFLLMRRQKNMENKVISVVVFLFFPIVFNSIEIFVANGDGIVHGLMVFGSVFIFLLPIILREWNYAIIEEAEEIDGKKSLMLSTTICGALLVLCFAHLDNFCYYKANLYQEQAKQYYNRLLTRVEETEGYEPGMPILLWGTFSEETYVAYDEFDDIKVTGYDGFGVRTMVNNWTYDLERFFPTHNGYPVNILTDTSGIIFDERYLNLSTYPGAGCMKVIDDVLVVRLSE